MKKFISSFLLCFALLEVHGQVNLVPNPSFEERTGCPQGFPDLDGKLNEWMSFRGTPDYFNNCSSISGYSSSRGYQEPNKGEGYIGIGTFQKTVANLREHIGIELIQPLDVNQRYYFSCFVVAGYTPLQLNIATNKIGAKLTTTPYEDPDMAYSLPNNSTFFTQGIIEDTINWTKITGSFVADSAYKYLILGSFFDDNNIDTSYFPFQVVPQIAYYLFDDICLCIDSVYCQTWTTLQTSQIEENKFVIYPIPATTDLNITATQKIERIEIINNLGSIILTEVPNNLDFSINVQQLEIGMYTARLLINSNYFYSKILIHQKP
jgi:hypothetical protein